MDWLCVVDSIHGRWFFYIYLIETNVQYCSHNTVPSIHSTSNTVLCLAHGRKKKNNNRTYCNSVLTVEIWSRSDIRCIGLVALVYRGITEKITAKWIHRQVACTRGRVYTCFSSSYSRPSQMLDENGPEEDWVSVDGLPAYTRHGWWSEVSSPLSSRGELKWSCP